MHEQPVYAAGRRSLIARARAPCTGVQPTRQHHKGFESLI
jgi:hypothetical protein